MRPSRNRRWVGACQRGQRRDDSALRGRQRSAQRDADQDDMGEQLGGDRQRLGREGGRSATGRRPGSWRIGDEPIDHAHLSGRCGQRAMAAGATRTKTAAMIAISVKWTARPTPAPAAPHVGRGWKGTGGDKAQHVRLARRRAAGSGSSRARCRAFRDQCAPRQSCDPSPVPRCGGARLRRYAAKSSERGVRAHRARGRSLRARRGGRRRRLRALSIMDRCRPRCSRAGHRNSGFLAAAIKRWSAASATVTTKRPWSSPNRTRRR